MRKRAERCVNFNGLMNDKCRAGVEYDSVRAAPDQIAAVGARHGLPCFEDGCGSCAQQRFPTEAERAQREKELLEFLGFMHTARVAIRKHAGYTGKKPSHDMRGTVECPKCRARLGYSVSSYNGHIWGRCETPNCLMWME